MSRHRSSVACSFLGAASLALIACAGGQEEPVPFARPLATSAGAKGVASASFEAAAPGGDGTQAELTIRVVGVRNDRGHLLVAVHDSAEAFPGDEEAAVAHGRAKAVASTTTLQVSLPHGEYAVVVLHDENDNRELDTSWVGIPKEGIGASNDAQGSFGPPSFDDARFRLEHDRAAVDIELVYF